MYSSMNRGVSLFKIFFIAFIPIFFFILIYYGEEEMWEMTEKSCFSSFSFSPNDKKITMCINDCCTCHAYGTWETSKIAAGCNWPYPSFFVQKLAPRLPASSSCCRFYIFFDLAENQTKGKEKDKQIGIILIHRY